MTVQVVLDTTAVIAYACGSPHVGEILAEISDEGTRFAVPLPCLVEAASMLDPKQQSHLDLLAALPHAVVVPLEFDGWRQVAAAVALFGGFGRGAAVVLYATGRARYIVTGEPDVYDSTIDTIAV